MSLKVNQISLDEEYKKHKHISREDIRRLREWLVNQPHLPNEHITELDLILTYHCCERSDIVSKEVLDLHFTIKTMFTKFFSDRVVDKTVADTLNCVAMLPLKGKDGFGYIYAHLIKPEPKYFNLTDTARTLMMVIDLWQYEEGTWPGFSVIVNFENVSWSHVTRLDLSVLRQVIYFVQECILLKLKHIHLLNVPSFIDKFMMIIKPLMKKELFEKIKLYERNADLTIPIPIPKNDFPKDCGGNNLSCLESSERMLKRLKDNADFFKTENLKRINESLRPGKKPEAVEEIGVQGSFKKLDID